MSRVPYKEITDPHVVAQALRQEAARHPSLPRPTGTGDWMRARADQLEEPTEIERAIADELRRLAHHRDDELTRTVLFDRAEELDPKRWTK